MKQADLSRNRCNIDDAAALPLQEDRNDGFTQQIRSSKIKCQRFIPEIVIEVGNWSRVRTASHPGIVHEDVYRSKSRLDLPNNFLGLRAVEQVGRECDGLLIHPMNLCSDRVQLGLGSCDCCNPGTLFGEG